MHCMFFWTDQK